ncbi:hypothetical protein QBC38DRAFT_506100 [Podospora fimiseda]|uniref:Uncharacterized protein n=1 Tax=Podospora fimiseda TaxID=252190 RepID=A0AAN7BZR8_9PEZI|nr:hypothetical protein QBC38DRAFT_506100 [Podospora fimiseda]
MKSIYLLAALASGIIVEARMAANLSPRQRGGSCAWTGHCIGDPCKTNRECDGDLDCINNKCANPGSVPTTTARTTIRTTTARTTARPTPTPVTPTCGWTGHCIGDPCDDENDCDNDYICRNKKCAAAGTTVVVPTTTSTTRRITTSTTTRRTTTAVTPVPPTSTAKPPTGGGPKCESPLACIGTSCTTDADCGFDLIICKNGLCGL